jgi:sugar lactone lactonase YvrE
MAARNDLGEMRTHATILLLSALLAIAGLSAAPAASGRAASSPGLSFSSCFQDPARPTDPGCASLSQMVGGSDVQFSPDGRSVYVAADGTHPSYDGALLVFDRDPTSGALTPRQCFEGTTGSDDPACSNVAGMAGVESIAVTGDGRSVYVQTSDGALVALARDGSSGALTPVQCFDNGIDTNDPSCTALGTLGGFQVVSSPDGRFVYATGGREIRDRGEFPVILAFRRDPATSALTYSSASMPTMGQLGHRVNTVSSAVDGMAISPDGRFMYVADNDNSLLVQLKRNPASGALAVGHCLFGGRRRGPITCPYAAGLIRPEDVVAGANDWIYAVAMDSFSIVSIRQRAGGALRAGHCLSQKRNRGCRRLRQRGLPFPNSVAASADGRSVYAMTARPGTLLALDASRSGGLSFAGCLASKLANGCRQVPGLIHVEAAAASPDGRSLLTVGGNSLDIFTRTPG